MLCVHGEQLSFENITCCPGVLEYSLLSHSWLQQVSSHFWGSFLSLGEGHDADVALAMGTAIQGHLAVLCPGSRASGHSGCW